MDGAFLRPPLPPRSALARGVVDLLVLHLQEGQHHAVGDGHQLQTGEIRLTAALLPGPQAPRRATLRYASRPIPCLKRSSN